MRTFLSIAFYTIIGLLLSTSGYGQDIFDHNIMPGAASYAQYIPSLKGKRVAVVINQTSAVGDSFLLDILLHRGVQVCKIFVPEHGFRGKEDAGAHIDNSIDSATKLPVVSLYGKHKKPTADDLAGIDVLIYDLQDVGVRFYTYISTLQYCMEACGQNAKKIIVLDRPDPNGFYVDGPVLQKPFRSFVGMQQVPVVYGMTPGEYAGMLYGEHLLDSVQQLDMQVVPCTGYTHAMKYKLPIAPSPNLKDMAAVYAYPSLCLFEGTPVSVGRGTDMPFHQFGCPQFLGRYNHTFTPQSTSGAMHPPYENKMCYGRLVAVTAAEAVDTVNGRFKVEWLIEAYNNYADKGKFFAAFFQSLAGTDELAGQIKAGKSAEDIRQSWQKQIQTFKKTRKKYLLYTDFE